MAYVESEDDATQGVQPLGILRTNGNEGKYLLCVGKAGAQALDCHREGRWSHDAGLLAGSRLLPPRHDSWRSRGDAIGLRRGFEGDVLKQYSPHISRRAWHDAPAARCYFEGFGPFGHALRVSRLQDCDPLLAGHRQDDLALT